MVEDKTITVAPGVTRIDWTWCYLLRGRKADLLRAGLAKESWFASGQEKTKRGYVVRSKYAEHEGRKVKCTEQPHTGRHTIQVWFTNEECQNIEQRHEFAKMRAMEHERISNLASSHDEFTAFVMVCAKASLYTLHRLAFEGHSGYRYSAETVEALKCASAELLEILQEGETLFSAERRQAQIHKIKADTAAADPYLANFLKRMTKEAGQAAP